MLRIYRMKKASLIIYGCNTVNTDNSCSIYFNERSEVLLKEVIHITNSFKSQDTEQLKAAVTAKVEKLINNKLTHNR